MFVTFSHCHNSFLFFFWHCPKRNKKSRQKQLLRCFYRAGPQRSLRSCWIIHFDSGLSPIRLTRTGLQPVFIIWADVLKYCRRCIVALIIISSKLCKSRNKARLVFLRSVIVRRVLFCVPFLLVFFTKHTMVRGATYRFEAVKGSVGMKRSEKIFFGASGHCNWTC